MTNSKNKWMLGILIVSVLVFITSVSYALWSMTLTQKKSNVITTGCFQIEFQDANPISLSETYPITDEEGLKLEPYTFTITNTCESYATYQINLEILNTTTLNRLEFVKNSLNEKEPSVLTNFDTVQTTLENATTSKKLETGYLDKNESKTFTLRLWLDEDTPAILEVMNKTIESKVTIITSLLPVSPSYAEVITNCSNNGYRTVDCMLENSKYDTVNLAYDETIDNNLRYIGANPKNYVEFNNEKWRIIGVMNNVEDADGKKDSRLKLMRDESIGEFSWDSSVSNVNGGYGINEWSQADVKKLMNPGYESESVGGSLYWNRTSGNCYNNNNNGMTSCSFVNSGLLENYKNMIGKIIWHVGSNGNNNYLTSDDGLVSHFYNYERSQDVGKICTSGNYCNDNVERKTTWIGVVGLLNPSDYGYAFGIENRNFCLNHSLYWKTDEVNGCKTSNWLFQKSPFWTMSPGNYISSLAAYHAFALNENGCMGLWETRKTFKVYPTLFLKSNVQITSGVGSKENSYQLELIGE